MSEKTETIKESMNSTKNGVKNKDSLKEFKNDLSGIGHTSPESTQGRIANFITANKFLILGVMFIGLSAMLWLFTVPEWVYVTIIGLLITGIVSYIPIKKATQKLIQDNRIPVMVIPNTLDAYIDMKVPRDMIETVRQEQNVTPYEVAVLEEEDGEEVWKTGYVFSKFEIKSQEGEQVINAEANWQGSKSNFEVVQKEKNVEIMRQTIEPDAKKWQHLKMAKPLYAMQMARVIVNMYAQKFEGVTHDQNITKQFNDILNIDRIEEAVENANEEDVQNNIKEGFEDIDIEDEQLEKMADMVNGGDE